mgnify:CR=1 FL=1
MNRRQLQKLGVPPKFAAAAIDALRNAASQELGFGLKGKRAKDLMQAVVRAPEAFLHDPIWGKLAQEMSGYEPVTLREPISYRTWGEEIDQAAHAQMRDACRVPSSDDASRGHGSAAAGRRLAGESVARGYTARQRRKRPSRGSIPLVRTGARLV